MTTLSAAAVIFVVILIFSVVCNVHGLGGSATTVSVSYGTTVTVCGIVAGQPSQRIQCWRDGQVFDVFSNISFESIAGGRDVFCGVRSGGSSLVCWNPSLTPKRLYYNETVLLRQLTIGDGQICGITNSSGLNVECWRSRDELSIQNRQFQSISSGLGFTCGVVANNADEILCFGTNSELARDIQGNFTDFRMLNVAVGGNHACGVNSTGFLICRGHNDYGQINVPKHSPFEFSALALGSNHTCALRKMNSHVVCWGGGGGILSDYAVGVSFESIVAGLDFTCGLTTNNLSVICWGEGWVRNSSRQASRAFRRQRSGTSSKHADREEEFTFADLALATDNFSQNNKIGAGSFGIVYKGKLLDGREVAIKRGETSHKTKKFQEKESAFDSELAFLSRLHHKHLVRLVGYCEEREEKLLVYEYMKNGALYDHLHDKKNTEKSSSLLNSWKMRIKISLDAARGIEYLHNYAVPPIIHRDIKSSNILLDANWVARILDKRVGPPEVNEAEAVELMAYTAIHCVNLEGRERPTMSDIVANLERAVTLCDDSHGSISSGQISIVSE
ncbi:hypothetical protein Ccrd_011650 [Cynara cardunculus var. scolymus]|uniref:Protein kinase domain-containing protein n=1 Tax=Cynara cardunculus var. scolymus TaxID=59895 RepID=A0A103YIW7_CYNCS|nr:hypothetical protein Ccrd_011650 [Cynara cardunculus var. scolymus]